VNEIEVRCEPVSDGGWRCRVRVADAAGASAYDVTVPADGPFPPSVLPDPELPDVDRLVRMTFEFLLERESRTSILRAFDLRDVTRYFPDYPSEIRRRLGA
jgi:hypothetical protein